MSMRGKYVCVLSILAFGFAAPAFADDATAKPIAQAESAAPPEISAQATIVDGGKVLRKGSNGWTCMPHTMPGDNAPMCNDAVWMKLMQAVGSKSDFQTDRVGIS